MNHINKKILIIEDEKPMADALFEKFSKEGFLALIAKNGEEGISLAQKEHPDLVILDILMPRIDGTQVLKNFREDGEWGKKVPVIILTNVEPGNAMMAHITENEPSYYFVKSDWKIDDIIEKAKGLLENNN